MNLLLIKVMTEILLSTIRPNTLPEDFGIGGSLCGSMWLDHISCLCCRCCLCHRCRLFHRCSFAATLCYRKRCLVSLSQHSVIGWNIIFGVAVIGVALWRHFVTDRRGSVWCLTVLGKAGLNWPHFVDGGVVMSDIWFWRSTVAAQVVCCPPWPQKCIWQGCGLEHPCRKSVISQEDH